MVPHSFRIVAFCVAALAAGCGGRATTPQVIAQPQARVPAAQVTAMTFASSTKLVATGTSCADLYHCTYTVTDSAGTGSAVTYDAYPYNTVATYQLPGETAATTTPAFNSTILGVVASTYNVSGSFTSIDVSTEKVVKGVTNDYILRTSHCFRTCTYSYSLVSGTLAFTLTSFEATSITIACAPATFNAGGSTTCTATAADLANASNVPSGSIAFSSSQAGTFTPRKCTLVAGACTVKFVPADESVGGITLTGTYGTNGNNYKSAGTIVIDVIAT